MTPDGEKRIRFAGAAVSYAAAVLAIFIAAGAMLSHCGCTKGAVQIGPDHWPGERAGGKREAAGDSSINGQGATSRPTSRPDDASSSSFLEAIINYTRGLP